MQPKLALAIALAACGGAKSPSPAHEQVGPSAAATYVGSLACRPCHAQIYDRWKVTPMANVVRDPREHPEAVIPDFTKPDPLLTFTLADVALVYGSRWKQRYFKRVGNDYAPLPAQWDVTHGGWKPYHVPDTADWWVQFYPQDNMERPTSALCDGCHSVNYDVKTKTVTEWNVGCERCHGPGSEHSRAPTKTNVFNPANMDPVAANDVCIQCHSQGRPLTPPSPGNAFDWPVGYQVGLRLADYWQLEPHMLGETTFTHFADGTAHKNRMQGNDFVQSEMYLHGIRCFSCHDSHGTNNPAQLVVPTNEVCSQCHSPGGDVGPRAKTLEAHTHHRADSPGSQCVACHMPKIEQTLGDVMVRSHTFRFITPSSNMPNPCTSCHVDKPTSWATAALRTWTSESPWRVTP
ncbi:MAG TPA: cytochrome c3 family protein [Kofleriaceae bacterium]